MSTQNKVFKEFMKNYPYLGKLMGTDLEKALSEKHILRYYFESCSTFLRVMDKGLEEIFLNKILTLNSKKANNG